MKPFFLLSACLFFASFGFAQTYSPQDSSSSSTNGTPSRTFTQVFPVTYTETQWRKILTREQYRILREQKTERANDNAFYDNKAHGQYICAGCDQLLFNSDDKFQSGTGWPSFKRLANPAAIGITIDRSGGGGRRIEVHCSNCGGHLGHLFTDGPAPTGLHYSMNSGAMKFLGTVKPEDRPQKPVDHSHRHPNNW